MKVKIIDFYHKHQEAIDYTYVNNRKQKHFSLKNYYKKARTYNPQFTILDRVKCKNKEIRFYKIKEGYIKRLSEEEFIYMFL